MLLSVKIINQFIYLPLVLLTFLALPFLFLLGSFLRFLLTAEPIAFLPPLALKLAALLLLKHLGLPSPFLLSPHLPILSPLVLYRSQPPPPAPPFLPLPNHARRFSNSISLSISRHYFFAKALPTCNALWGHSLLGTMEEARHDTRAG